MIKNPSSRSATKRSAKQKRVDRYHVNAQEITGLCVVNPNHLWFCDVGGRRVEPTTDDLQTPQRFQKACMERVHVIPQISQVADWQVIVSMLMDSMREMMYQTYL